MGIFFKSVNRRNRVAVFDAGGIATNETRPFLNITLAQILADAQLTEFDTDLHRGRLHQASSARKMRPLFLFHSHGARGFRRREGIIPKVCFLVKFDDDCSYVVLSSFDVFKRAEAFPFC